MTERVRRAALQTPEQKKMIATLRRRLIGIPARLIRHSRGLTLRPPPGYPLLAEVLTRIRALPTPT